jgi:hypothetical protein
MTYWNTQAEGSHDADYLMEAPRVDRFLAEITEVCRRYGLSIVPDYNCEDGFIVEEFTEEANVLLNTTNINLDPGDLV